MHALKNVHKEHTKYPPSLVGAILLPLLIVALFCVRPLVLMSLPQSVLERLTRTHQHPPPSGGGSRRRLSSHRWLVHKPIFLECCLLACRLTLQCCHKFHFKSTLSFCHTQTNYGVRYWEEEGLRGRGAKRLKGLEAERLRSSGAERLRGWEAEGLRG